MNWLITRNNRAVKINDIPEIKINVLNDEIKERFKQGLRLTAFFGCQKENHVKLYVVLADDEKSRLYVTSTIFTSEQKSYPSFTVNFPAFHLFEREFYEDFGILPEGHPWLKPVRYPSTRFNNENSISDYPFFKIEGEAIHEVAVGPVHAGIIEPGHFRFNAMGEKVFHLEIQLGYQHRGIEKLFIQPSQNWLTHLAESISGDSLIAHTTSYCNAMEALCSSPIISRKAQLIRGIALELERTAMHIADLSALCNDVAYLLGSSVYGATRTLVINSLLEICGSRFGKSLIKVGGVGFDINKELALKLNKTLTKVLQDVKGMSQALFDTPSVLSRFENTGTVSLEDAQRIGMVGLSARASGIPLDVRSDHPMGVYQFHPVYKFALETGDVFARAYLRYLEIEKSINMILEMLQEIPQTDTLLKECSLNMPESMVISMVEGFRGELVHIAFTDEENKISRYKIIDPSFHNWFALALAVRNNEISDFPLCNKSFNLSYCGFDL